MYIYKYTLIFFTYYIDTYIYYTYVIIKTIHPPGYHRNGFVATHALGHMMYDFHDNRQGTLF